MAGAARLGVSGTSHDGTRAAAGAPRTHTVSGIPGGVHGLSRKRSVADSERSLGSRHSEPCGTREAVPEDVPRLHHRDHDPDAVTLTDRHGLGPRPSSTGPPAPVSLGTSSVWTARGKLARALQRRQLEGASTASDPGPAMLPLQLPGTAQAALPMALEVPVAAPWHTTSCAPHPGGGTPLAGSACQWGGPRAGSASAADALPVKVGTTANQRATCATGSRPAEPTRSDSRTRDFKFASTATDHDGDMEPSNSSLGSGPGAAKRLRAGRADNDDDGTAERHPEALAGVQAQQANAESGVPKVSGSSHCR